MRQKCIGFAKEIVKVWTHLVTEHVIIQIGLSVAMGNVNHLGYLKHMFVTTNVWILKFLAEENVIWSMNILIVIVFVKAILK